MTAIPETGGGLSGFLGHLLWKFYQYFPSSGHWDWLLLILLLGVLVRVLYLPWLWKSVEADMTLLKTGKVGVSTGTEWPILWDTAYALFLAWFFWTTAGQTFVSGRSGSPDAVARRLFWLTLIACVALVVILISTFETRVNKRNKAIAPKKSEPYPDRDLMSLYGGGGVFFIYEIVDGKLTKNAIIQIAASLMCKETVAFILVHLFYWYWSVVSVTIFLVFVVTGALTEMVRMLFVYILHKRTFG